MTITWKKLGEAWVVQSSQKQEIGASVAVTNRSGQSKTVTLGACVGGNDWGYFYEVAKDAPRATAQVGDVGGIMTLFNGATKRLKFPAIELSMDPLEPLLAQRSMRVNVAGARAKVPGSLTVLTGERDGFTGQRGYLGRILQDGTFQPGRNCPPEVAPRLVAFAAEPARIAGEQGRMTGRCCFCRLLLTDARSTAVGYGETCAANWGLPWGKASQRVA